MATSTPRPNVPGNCRYFIVIGFTLFGVVDALEEFLFPVAIPHTEDRTDKEILFLGRYLSSFLHVFITSPKHFTAFCHYCSRFAAGRIKHSLFREFPQIISYRVCLYSLFQSLSALPSLQGSQNPCASH